MGEIEARGHDPRALKAPPSLLQTQVGLGAVRLDASGRPLQADAQAPSTRFVVTPGSTPGQLVLTAVSEATRLEPTSLVVSLSTESAADARRLARAIIGLS